MIAVAALIIYGFAFFCYLALWIVGIFVLAIWWVAVGLLALFGKTLEKPRWINLAERASDKVLGHKPVHHRPRRSTAPSALRTPFKDPVLEQYRQQALRAHWERQNKKGIA